MRPIRLHGISVQIHVYVNFAVKLTNLFYFKELFVNFGTVFGWHSAVNNMIIDDVTLCQQSFVKVVA